MEPYIHSSAATLLHQWDTRFILIEQYFVDFGEVNKRLDEWLILKQNEVHDSSSSLLIRVCAMSNLSNFGDSSGIAVSLSSTVWKTSSTPWIPV